VTSEKGELVLLRATPERQEEVARFAAIKGKTWNHPALVGNRVYVRNGEEAACFELSLAPSP
jgi:outer membrane protein assembly factor BamB